MDAIAHNYARRAAEYRKKAEELRTIAATMGSKRETFLVMAADYLHMAEILERMAGEANSKP